MWNSGWSWVLGQFYISYILEQNKNAILQIWFQQLFKDKTLIEAALKLSLTSFN